MYCSKCGALVEDNHKFCSCCGQPVTHTAEPVQNESSNQQCMPAPESVTAEALMTSPADVIAPPPVVSPAIPSVKKEMDKGVKVGIGIAVVVLAVICLVGVAIWVGSSSNKKSARPQEQMDEITQKDTQEETPKSTQEVVVTAEETQIEETVVEESSEAEAQEAQPMGPVELYPYPLLEYSSSYAQLQRNIITMNADSYQHQTIDVYEIRRSVGERNDTYTWDSNAFYTLEGFNEQNEYCNKDLCVLVKKELINRVTGNVMDYEIYLNPVTQVANKIVSLEYLTGGIEVTEYYYSNDCKPNFIFQYQTDNYVSTFATPDKLGQRFMFCNDCMTNWRVIDESGKANYVRNTAEYERLTEKWDVSTLILYDNVADQVKEIMDQTELKMLNAAYNTYEIVLNAEGISVIQGCIYDQYQQGLGDATICLYDAGFQNELFRTSTQTDGTYKIYVPFETNTYAVGISKEGFDECRIYSVEVNNEQIGIYQDSVQIFESSQNTVPVYMTFGDAFHYNQYGDGMMLLSNAYVNIRPGINNRFGADIIYSGMSDYYGYFEAYLRPGVYTIEVASDGYETMYYSIIANPISSNVYEFYAAPTLYEGQYAIVLTWGEYPNDLDSHLFTTYNNVSNHIWYGKMYDSFNNSLDVDDTSSYGPETVTIDTLNPNSYYKYCVVDFTDCANDNLSSYDMSYSQATVNVYSSNGLVGTFHVPTNTPGVIWEVFEIRNGKLTPIQRYYDNVTNKDWWHSEK